MEDMTTPGTDAPAAPAAPAMPTAPVAAARPRRRWLRVLVYLLAGIGVLALILVGLGFYLQSKVPKTAPRVTIDEVTVIENLMTGNYGKYSDAKKGWLYVGDDNLPYLMRVVQQTKIPDGPDGDELYFVASGTAVDGSANAIYAAYYVRPTQPYDGGLTHTGMQFSYQSTIAVRPEQVHFEALSDNLWGWVIKARTGNEPEGVPVVTTNTILAPHDGKIATLGEFLAASDATPDVPCDQARAAWDAVDKAIADGNEEVDGETEIPLRCDKRRWNYRTATVNGTIPVPITVTAGGTLDGQPVEARSWKLMFDPKSFTYDVPAELQNK